MNESGMKTCRYCDEQVRAEAIKCKHCGSYIGSRRVRSGDWYRASDDRMIAGVCRGLADEFGLPVAVVRLAFVLATLFAGGIGMIVYGVLWVVMPQEDWIRETHEDEAPRRTGSDRDWDR